jgi:hypothetical protein
MNHLAEERSLNLNAFDFTLLAWGSDPLKPDSE